MGNGGRSASSEPGTVRGMPGIVRDVPSVGARSAPRYGRAAAILGVVLSLGLGPLLGACGGSVTTLSTPPTTDGSVVLTIQRSPEGPILATGGGSTLYDFGPDTPTHSACVNVGCVYQWPPLI